MGWGSVRKLGKRKRPPAGIWSHCPQGNSSPATHSGYLLPLYQGHRHASKLPFLLHAIIIPPSTCFPCHSATFLALRLLSASQEQRLSSPAFSPLHHSPESESSILTPGRCSSRRAEIHRTVLMQTPRTGYTLSYGWCLSSFLMVIL